MDLENHYFENIIVVIDSVKNHQWMLKMGTNFVRKEHLHGPQIFPYKLFIHHK